MNEIDLDSVRGHVEILRYCKAEKAKIAELEKLARTAVEDAMGGNEIGLLDGEPAINWSHFKERRFDQSAFGEDHPDLLEQYRAAREKRRFEVL
jgi:hypothetical protein